MAVCLSTLSSFFYESHLQTVLTFFCSLGQKICSACTVKLVLFANVYILCVVKYLCARSVVRIRLNFTGQVTAAKPHSIDLYKHKMFLKRPASR